MPDEPYSLSDLASLADVTPRTIRYYVAQGLLPSPEAAGPATRYGEGHLLRLRLIKRLQRDHLPLAEIRVQAGADGGRRDRTAARRGTCPGRAPAPAETLAFVRDLMAQSGVQPLDRRPRPRRRPLLKRVAEFEPMIAGLVPAAVRAGLDAGRRAGPRASTPPPVQPGPAPATSPSIPVAPGSRRPPDRSTWERLAVTPDVELHVRRPLDRLTNKKVEQLVRIARELFDRRALTGSHTQTLRPPHPASTRFEGGHRDHDPDTPTGSSTPV